MPPAKRRAIGRLSRKAKELRIARSQETEEEHLLRLSQKRQREHHRHDKEGDKDDDEEETTNGGQNHLDSFVPLKSWFKAAFNYDAKNKYSSNPKVIIGNMSKICTFCSAKKFPGESKGLCCSNGKMSNIVPIQDPPNVLQHLLTNTSDDARHFQKNLRKYNAAFQMTSFGADNDCTDYGFFTTFRIQGQCYHSLGSLLPMPNESHKFAQIYFMGSSDEEAKQRNNALGNVMRMNIILDLQELLHTHHSYVSSFKYALEKMEEQNDCKVIIRYEVDD